MVSLATQTDRTLFFDFLPLDLGIDLGLHDAFQLYTVPGQVYYATTRKLVLQGADGVVFVGTVSGASSMRTSRACRTCTRTLAEQGIDARNVRSSSSTTSRICLASSSWMSTELDDAINFRACPFTPATPPRHRRLRDAAQHFGAGAAPPERTTAPSVAVGR
jgi:hypothetical protein